MLEYIDDKLKAACEVLGTATNPGPGQKGHGELAAELADKAVIDLGIQGRLGKDPSLYSPDLELGLVELQFQARRAKNGYLQLYKEVSGTDLDVTSGNLDLSSLQTGFTYAAFEECVCAATIELYVQAALYLITDYAEYRLVMHWFPPD